MFDTGGEVLGDPITGAPVDEDPDDPMTDDDDSDGESPVGEQPVNELPEGEQDDDEELPGETPGEEETAEAVAGAWLLDFPEADTPWESDGKTFTSETCTWSEVFPVLAEVSLIAGPIECTDGILPTIGFGIISEGEMSAVAIRLLWIFPIVTPRWRARHPAKRNSPPQAKNRPRRKSDPLTRRKVPRRWTRMQMSLHPRQASRGPSTARSA
jgi:hypothetical protein